MNLDARAGGTKTRPELSLRASLDSVRSGSLHLERVESAGEYRDGRFTASLDIFHNGQTALRATALLPMDVTLFSVDMSRDSLRRFSIRADSADLGIIQTFAQQSVKRAARYGADGWLTKPIRKDDLLALLGLGERRPAEPGAQPPPAATPARFPKQVAAPKRPHVLVVDDDRDILEYCRAVLADAGAVVDAIQDPSSFREVLPPGGRYDLVLVDLFMPGMDGIEVLQRFSGDVRNCASRLYVITVSDDPSLRTLAQRSGADGYLTKPLERNALLELLA